MRVPKRQFEKWIRALRSGDFKQTHAGALQDSTGYCCLGVAAEICVKEHKRDAKTGFLLGGFPALRSGDPAWLANINSNFGRITGIAISELNDSGVSPHHILGKGIKGRVAMAPLTFDEIADLLEAVYVHKVMK